MLESSTKPYLLRAIYEWCTDNGFTPFLAARVSHAAKVPMQFVKDGEIVLNISFEATSGLKMDNDMVQFSARFGGVAREIQVPVENVLAIYARENGQGMAFEVSLDEQSDDNSPKTEIVSSDVSSVSQIGTAKRPSLVDVSEEGPPDPEPPKKTGRPTLTRIK